MLYSQGVKLEDLGVPRSDDGAVETDGRKIWRLFASHWYLFRGAPSRLWFEHALETVFGIEDRLTEKNADAIYDRIAERLTDPSMRPRALYKQFGIEVISTTDAATDDLAAHDAILKSGWSGGVVPAYRPDAVVDASRGTSVPMLRTLLLSQALGWTIRAISRRIVCGVPISKREARPQAIMAIRMRAPQICPPPRRRRCSIAC